jgi:dTDP-4-amino-4,6-dideoxygalactose transaminase
MRVPDTYGAEPIPEAARAEIDRLLSSGDLFRYTAPSDAPVARLEAEFARTIGARYAVAVSSCSSALFLALRALGIEAPGRVAIPAFTFAAVPSSVVHAGLTPVLVECGDDLRIDLGDLEAKADGVAAILVSHMRGHTSDMDAIMEIAGRRGIPVVEDAAHSLGTTWRGRRIGTLGRIGCFSFQSYKLLNSGEGGMLVTDDPELAARAVMMSGAYERNWQKHPVDQAAFARWQNRLPLYNLRLGNLSAAVLLPQLPHLSRRVADGRRNHDHVAERLEGTRWFAVPAPLEGEVRAPDSIQFALTGMTDLQIAGFVAAAGARGLSVQVFGASPDNARAYWNWQFLGDVPDLPKTRAMLMRTCDVRLPARLTLAECDIIADVLIDAAAEVERVAAA